MQKVIPAAGGFAGKLTGIVGAAGPVGIGLGVITGAVAALGAVLNKAGKEAANLIETATLTGTDVESIQRGAGAFDSVTESTKEALAASNALRRVFHDLELAIGGAVNVALPD